MSEAAVLEKPVETRRLYIADLTLHGPWLMQRLLKNYPNHNERSIIGWLNGILDDNSFICLMQPNAVGIAERISVDRLSQRLIVREVLVWCRDKENTQQQQQAITLYDKFADWGRMQGIQKMVIGESSDVPVSALREKFQRVNEVKTYFVRIQ
jgi:hypothetical protein